MKVDWYTFDNSWPWRRCDVWIWAEDWPEPEYLDKFELESWNGHNNHVGYVDMSYLGVHPTHWAYAEPRELPEIPVL